MALTPHQKRFKKASAVARKTCHKKTTTPGAYSTCFGKSMSKALKGKGAKKGAKKGVRKCVGIVQTGARKGKLKKGFKWPGGGKCPVKAKRKK